MNQKSYRYSFNDKLPLQNIEDSLFLAVLATECLYGRSRIRLDASFCLKKKKRFCVIDASTEVGYHIARIFTGFLISEFGVEAFRIKRSDDAHKDTESPSNERNNTMSGLGIKNKFF